MDNRSLLTAFAEWWNETRVSYNDPKMTEAAINLFLSQLGEPQKEKEEGEIEKAYRTIFLSLGGTEAGFEHWYKTSTLRHEIATKIKQINGLI